MLSRNEHYEEVRGCNLVPLPNCSANSKATRNSAGYVSNVFASPARFVLSGRKIESSIKALCRRRKSCTTAVLVSTIGQSKDQVHEQPSTPSSVNFGVRGWSNAWHLDNQDSKRVGWIISPSSWGATGMKPRTPVRAPRIGTTPLRTRTTTSGLAASVTTLFSRSATTTVSQADLALCGQPVLSCFGKYTARFNIAQSSEISKGAADFMSKKYRNLIEKIADMDNLRDAFARTAKAKKITYGYLQFNEYSEANLALIREELLAGQYKIGGYRQFTVREPKPRLISALDFKDRLVQHAVCNIISPIFEAILLPNTFACREGRGTHAGVHYIQSKVRQTGYKYFLKTDYSKFFPSVDRAVLHQMIERKITCRKTLAILQEIIPPEGSGIPIGSLTSQLFANVYGNAVDRFIHFELGHRYWARYMDDIVILGNDLNQLREDFKKIEAFSLDVLKMRISKWQASPISQGINFLGYRIWPTHKLIRKDSVRRAKRKIARYVANGDELALQKFVASWRGHAQHADTCNLFNYLEKKYGSDHQYA